jgi:hypothetical protein
MKIHYGSLYCNPIAFKLNIKNYLSQKLSHLSLGLLT